MNKGLKKISGSQQKSHLILKIPSEILSSMELTENQKLIHSLTYTLSKEGKLGFNGYNHVEIAKMFNIHPNVVARCRMFLIDNNYEIKEKKSIYVMTQKVNKTKVSDKREIIIPIEIYSLKLTTGCKLLWGEYNSFSKNGQSYKASREFSAERLGCSIDSITNWTNKLKEKDLINYNLLSGREQRLKIVTTKLPLKQQEQLIPKTKKEVIVERVDELIEADNVEVFDVILDLTVSEKSYFEKLLKNNNISELSNNEDDVEEFVYEIEDQLFQTKNKEQMRGKLLLYLKENHSKQEYYYPLVEQFELKIV